MAENTNSTATSNVVADADETTEFVPLQHINNKGEYVDEDAEDVAYVINPVDPDKEKFVQSIRDKYEVEEAQKNKGIPLKPLSSTTSSVALGPTTVTQQPAVAPKSSASQSTAEQSGTEQSNTTPNSNTQNQTQPQTIEEAFGDRPANALHAAGHHTVDAVLALTNEQLDAIEGVGKGTLEKADKLRAERGQVSTQA
jgi:DNA-directed RNA polymerase alpha subunit